MKKINFKDKCRRFKDRLKHQKHFSFIRKLFLLNGFSYMPSSLTFYVFISVVPLASLILMITSRFNAPLTLLVEFLSDLMPESDISDTIMNYLQQIRPADIVALAFSTVFSIYIASRGIECFTRFADTFYNRHVLDRHFIRRKLRSILFTIIFIIAFSVIVLLLLFFNNLTDGILPGALSTFLKYVAGFLLFFACISSLFYFSPTKHPKFRDVLPGAYLASISILVFIGIFLVYTSFQSERYNTIYGPLSTIVILLLLVYFCCYIIFMCFYLNILIKEKKDKKRSEAELNKLTDRKDKDK